MGAIEQHVIAARNAHVTSQRSGAGCDPSIHVHRLANAQSAYITQIDGSWIIATMARSSVATSALAATRELDSYMMIR